MAVRGSSRLVRHGDLRCMREPRASGIAYRPRRDLGQSKGRGSSRITEAELREGSSGSRTTIKLPTARSPAPPHHHVAGTDLCPPVCPSKEKAPVENPQEPSSFLVPRQCRPTREASPQRTTRSGAFHTAGGGSDSCPRRFRRQISWPLASRSRALRSTSWRSRTSGPCR